MIEESLISLLIFGLIGLYTNWAGYNRGFYSWSKRPSIPLPLTQLVAVFTIYVGCIRLSPFLAEAMFALLAPLFSSGAILNSLQFTLHTIILICLLLFGITRGNSWISLIFQDRSLTFKRSFFKAVILGSCTWLLAFPIVTVVGQFCDILVYKIYGFKSFEQVAVRYLKTSITSPSELALALTTILIYAPLIEEILFRGYLQNFLKRYLGAEAAILLTALCFACFHYSASQGLGNISLITSLFTFALFLGFIYERQRSLYASISLHVTFNLISTMRILYFPEV
jgi:membrane protease YdiL (CAAX protease family)